MDLFEQFNEKASDNSVGYLVALVSAMYDWLAQYTRSLVPVINALHHIDQELAYEVRTGLANTAEGMGKLLDEVFVDTGNCVVFVKNLAIEFLQYSEPHNLSQKELLRRAAEVSEKLPQFVIELDKIGALATGQEAPEGYVEKMTSGIRNLMIKAVETV